MNPHLFDLIQHFLNLVDMLVLILQDRRQNFPGGKIVYFAS